MPVCTDHDPRAWHGLVKRDSAGAILCTYTHEHKDDPKALDYAFGPLPAYLGGEISYPWQTQNAATGALENDAKHRVYGWQVIDEPQCVSSVSTGYGLRRARIEQHEDGPLGATVRYHSFWAQIEWCNADGSSAYLETGGWLDTGSLFLDAAGCPPLTYIPTPGDNGPASVEQKLEGSVSCPRLDSTWYARRAGPVNVFFGLIKESWGALDPNDPTKLLFYGGTLNGSSQEPGHIVSLFFDGSVPGTYSGHTDHTGAIVDCTTLGPDCVPLVLRNVQPIVEYQFRADVGGIGMREYDVAGPTGVSLIRYPN